MIFWSKVITYQISVLISLNSCSALNSYTAGITQLSVVSHGQDVACISWAYVG